MQLMSQDILGISWGPVIFWFVSTSVSDYLADLGALDPNIGSSGLDKVVFPFDAKVC